MSNAIALAAASPINLPTSRVYGNDAALMHSWLRDRPKTTTRPYRAIVGRLLTFCAQPIQGVTRPMIESWLDTLGGANASYNARLTAVKSLFAFAKEVGYVTINPAAGLRRRRVPDRLADRILTEGEVHRALALEEDPRDHLLVRLAYVGGLRRAELSSLSWRDVRLDGAEAVLTVCGKGGKTRWVRLSAETTAPLCRLRSETAEPADPVFVSREGGRLSESAVYRAVVKAERRAGVTGQAVHSLRHSHVSHNLDRGTPIHVIAKTVGHSSLATTTRYAHIKAGESSGTKLGL